LFDASADPYEVSRRAGEFRNLPGVVSLEVLEAVGEGPRFLFEFEVEDGKDEEVAQRLKDAFRPYSEYISKLVTRTYRKIG